MTQNPQDKNPSSLTLHPSSFLRRVWRSIFRHGWPDTELNRSLAMTSNLFLHLHPVKVNRRSIRPGYTWGLGVLAIVLFVLLILTGMLLMFYYVPSTQMAYQNIVHLQTRVPYGQPMRNLHRWAAHGMVLVVLVHMVRVFYTGAYKQPREFNWGVGVALLLLTLVASFTGYLLPWDQLSFWAITVGTNIAGYLPVVGPQARLLMLGGVEVGQNALTRFYALHIMVIPGVMLLLASLHIWRVRKDGGLAAQDQPLQENVDQQLAPSNPDSGRLSGQVKTYDLMALVRGKTPLVDRGPEDTVFAFPVVALLEGLLFLGATLALIFFSMLRNAPLEEMANPDITTNPAKAPWYFLALQELLLHMHPVLAGVIIPALVLMFLLALPYIDLDLRDSGRWFATQRGLKWVGSTALYTVLAQSALVYFDEVTGLRGLGAASPFVQQFVGPLMFGGILFGLPLLIAWRATPSPREMMLVIFTIIIVSAMTLTVIGFLFRGPGMHLYFPWAMPNGYNPWDGL